MVQPIGARKVGEKFEIIAGERRWRAARAGLSAWRRWCSRKCLRTACWNLPWWKTSSVVELNAIEEAKAYWQLGEHLRLDPGAGGRSRG
ncbi:MAG: ParB N-terminal domain-containing protein [Holophaga sp.]|nr:ParB N-terminal domain-containing protein [Holophaga sp.]